MGLDRLGLGLAPLWLGSLLSLAIPLPASGEEVTLPPQWRRQDGPGFVWDELACSSTQVFALRSQKGVWVHDGQRWTPLPPCPACRGAQRMAVSPGGEVYLHTSQGVVVYSKGRWVWLDGSDWQGPVHSMRVLESGLLVLTGEGRLGVRKGLRLVSRDAGTWRRLDAVSGLGAGNFWTVGQGGTLMHHTVGGWKRTQLKGKLWLGGLHMGADSGWVWDRVSGHRVYRNQSGSWASMSQGLPEEPDNAWNGIAWMAGDAERPWAGSGTFVARFSGREWVVELDDRHYTGSHGFTRAACATAKQLWVSRDGHLGLLVRDRD